MASVNLRYKEIDLLVLQQRIAGDHIAAFAGACISCNRVVQNLKATWHHFRLPVICLIPLVISRPKDHQMQAGECQAEKDRLDEVVFHKVLNLIYYYVIKAKILYKDIYKK
jgi:hypothetical protein